MASEEIADEQAGELVDVLCSLDDNALASVMVTVLNAKPNIAPTVAEFLIPDLTYAPSKILVAKRATGSIKSYNQQSNFGFITCPELHEIYGRDVFAHGKQLRNLSVGTKVNFAIVFNKDGHPQAFDITDDFADVKGKGKGEKEQSASGKDFKGGKGMWGMSPGMNGGGGKAMVGWGMVPAYPYGMGGCPMYGMGWGMPDDGGMMMAGKGILGPKGGCSFKGSTKGTPSAAPKGASRAEPKGGKSGRPLREGHPDVKETIGQFVGNIKSFSEKNGYGFIECQDVRDLGYQDVFLHHAQLDNFKIGDQVLFTCFKNSKKQAQAMALLSPDAEREMDRPSPTSRGEGGKGRPDVQEVLGMYIGSIKNFNQKSGYGFITCQEIMDQGYKDVFVHHAQIGSFQPGEEVQFTAFLNKKGQVQAMELETPGGPPAKKSRH
jgi:cold shock CspA family protein